MESDCSSELDFTKQPARRKNIKPDAQRKLLKRALVDVLSEPPISVLHALVEKESFQFESVREGGHHKAILHIDGQIFTAQSVQKKTARDIVVMKALQHLFPNIAQELQQNSANNTLTVNVDPVLALASNKLNRMHITQNQNGSAAKKAKIEDCANGMGAGMKTIHDQLPRIESIVKFDKSLLKAGLKPKSVVRLVTQAVDTTSRDNPNAVNALHSLFDKEAYNYSVTKVGSDTQFEFETTLSIGSRMYTAVGKTIKKSKNNVTILALRDLFPEITSNLEKAIEDRASPDNTQSVDDQIEVVKMPDGWPQRRFSDFIANLVQNKYKEVVRDEPEHLQRYNVLAGIVMMQSGNFNDATVICVSTGNCN